MLVEGLVSTIIPVYNRGAMLREAVASVLSQSWRPIEIVIVDDGSSDDTPLVAQELETLLELPSRPTWRFPPRPWTSHVRWIAPNPHDGDVILVGIDLMNWTAHVANHRSATLWRFHALHHSQEDMSVFTTFRTHPLSHASYVIALLPALVLEASGTDNCWPFTTALPLISTRSPTCLEMSSLVTSA